MICQLKNNPPARLVGLALAAGGGYLLDLASPVGHKQAVVQPGDLYSFTRVTQIVYQWTGCHLLRPCPPAEWNGFVADLVRLAHGGPRAASQPRRLAA